MIVRGKAHAAIACVVLASLVSGAVSGAQWIESEIFFSIGPF
jgi:hypothetical protein